MRSGKSVFSDDTREFSIVDAICNSWVKRHTRRIEDTSKKGIKRVRFKLDNGYSVSVVYGHEFLGLPQILDIAVYDPSGKMDMTVLGEYDQFDTISLQHPSEIFYVLRDVITLSDAKLIGSVLYSKPLSIRTILKHYMR